MNIIQSSLSSSTLTPKRTNTNVQTYCLAKQLTELKLGNMIIDTDHVDCKMSDYIIDECSFQQGYSFNKKEFAYPTNHSHLMSSCRRQSDGFKCLKAYAKCLPPLSRQVLTALVQSRQKFNKKICTEKPGEWSNKMLEADRCILGHKDLLEKGMQVEIHNIAVPEAILNSKIETTEERLKYSCCSVASSRREFIDISSPHCKQHLPIATELVDSFLAETTSIICPDNEKQRNECDKLPKLPISRAKSRAFIFPTLKVIQTLA